MTASEFRRVARSQIDSLSPSDTIHQTQSKIPHTQTIVPREQPLIDAVVGGVEGVALGLGRALAGGVVDCFADEADAAVAEGKVGAAWMEAVKAFPLDYVVGGGRRVQRLIAVPHEGQRATSGAGGHIPMAVHRRVPGEIEMGHFAYQKRVARAVGDLRDSMLGIAAQHSIGP